MSNKSANIISKVVSIVWFIFAVLPISLLTPLMIINFMMDTRIILVSGFSIGSTGLAIFSLFGLIVGITMIVPPFRKCFHKLPWLYVYLLMMLIDMLIIIVGNSILNYGYEIQNATRHRIFIALMIGQLVICRLAMCIYFKFKPLSHLKSKG